MTKTRAKRLESEVKEALKAKHRYQWYKDIQRLKKQGWNIRDACKKVHVSRSMYYYWDRRVQEVLNCKKPGVFLRVDVFKEISKKPKYSPKKYSQETKKLIIKYKKRSRRGAEYIQWILKKKYNLNLSVTGIYKTLKREGLVTERKKYRKRSVMVNRVEYLPGEKVQVDTKHLKLRSGKKVYQFGAIDLATGIVLKAIYEHIDGNSSCDFLRRLNLFYPFRIEKIQTDNGFEYTHRLTPEIKKLHKFTKQCNLLGIQHVLIPPASPTYNSRIERTHRIDMEELYRRRKFNSLQQIKIALRRYLKYFNNIRTTKALDWKTPIEYSNDKFGLKIRRLNYSVLNV